MLHHVKEQSVTSGGRFTAVQPFQGQFLTVSISSNSLKKYTQLQVPPAPLLSRLLKRADDIASGAFLTFFSAYLVFHIVSAWPRIVEAFQA